MRYHRDAASALSIMLPNVPPDTRQIQACVAEVSWNWRQARPACNARASLIWVNDRPGFSLCPDARKRGRA
jgi:hypothetical protein